MHCTQPIWANIRAIIFCGNILEWTLQNTAYKGEAQAVFLCGFTVFMMDAWTFISNSNETTLPIKVSLEEMMSRLRNLTDCKLGQFNSSKKTCNVSERDPREADLFWCQNGILGLCILWPTLEKILHRSLLLKSDMI